VSEAVNPRAIGRPEGLGILKKCKERIIAKFAGLD
jgi:hypothetical protein